MAINFDELPKTNEAAFTVLENGTYRCKIKEALLEQHACHAEPDKKSRAARIRTQKREKKRQEEPSDILFTLPF